MDNFFRVAQGLDTQPVLMALQRHQGLWNQHPFRTTFTGTPHGEVDDILLRFSDPGIAKNDDTDAVMADGNSIWHPAAGHFPEIIPLVRALMHQQSAYQLDRLIITRLRPGKCILPHADNQGEYVHDPDRARFHVVLQGQPGCLYRTGDEIVEMLTGEIWWFNPHLEHEVRNNSPEDRLHLLVDIRTWPKVISPLRVGGLADADGAGK